MHRLRFCVPRIDLALRKSRVPRADHALRDLSVRARGPKSVSVGAIVKSRIVVELTERDLDILTFVGLAGYVSQPQLAGEFFTSHDRCCRRTRRLADAGYLRVTLAGSRRPFLFSITSEALRALEDRRPAVTTRVRAHGAIRLAGVEHHLAIVDTRLYVAQLVRNGPCPFCESSPRNVAELALWMSAEDRRLASLPFAAVRLRPDAVAEIACSEGVHRIAVEVDCGTETLDVIERKLSRYVLVFEQRAIQQLWWIVTAGERRTAEIANRSHAVSTGGIRTLQHGAITARPIAPPPPVIASSSLLRPRVGSQKPADFERFEREGPPVHDESRGESCGDHERREHSPIAAARTATRP